MHMNLSLVSLSMSDILGIDVTSVISLVLRINFSKIHMDSKVFVSMTLLFDKKLSLVNIIH